MPTKRQIFEKEIADLADPIKEAARILRDFPTTHTAECMKFKAMGNNLLIAVNNLMDRALKEDKKLRFVCARSAQEMERVTQALCKTCLGNVRRR